MNIYKLPTSRLNVFGMIQVESHLNMVLSTTVLPEIEEK